MKYMLIFAVFGFPPQQIGPFDNVFACEQAAAQVKLISPNTKHTRTACINLNAKPHHWNGKEIKK